jgi:hypothetical protein
MLLWRSEAYVGKVDVVNVGWRVVVEFVTEGLAAADRRSKAPRLGHFLPNFIWSKGFD